jgi:hypothetical protein
VTRLRRLVSLGLMALVPMALFACVGSALDLGRAGDVLHLVVIAHAPGDDAAGRRAEYWIDDTRGLARVVYETPQGIAVRATGTDWALDVPSQGAAMRYQTASVGTGPTREITGQLYYLRDALAAGRANVVSQDSRTIVVAAANGRSGMLDASTGLPVWEATKGDRSLYDYQAHESLPATRFPDPFFSDALGRQVSETVETSLAEAAAVAGIRLLVPGDGVAGRSLDKVLVTHLAASRTPEQVHQLYGADVQIVANLIAAPVSLDRPGGIDVATAAGAGKLYRDAWGTEILVRSGTVVYSVSAPTEDLARHVALALRAVQ